MPGRIVMDKLIDFYHKRSRARILVQVRYIVGFWLVEMAISTNQKPTIYRNLYENFGPETSVFTANVRCVLGHVQTSQ